MGCCEDAFTVIDPGVISDNLAGAGGRTGTFGAVGCSGADPWNWLWVGHFVVAGVAQFCNCFSQVSGCFADVIVDIVLGQ